MTDSFFDYDSSAECRSCASPCKYAVPRDPAYAKIAVCCSSLNLLGTTIHRSWTLDVEAGASSPQMTRWLVEFRRVVGSPALTATNLLICAIEHMNTAAMAEIHDAGGTTGLESHNLLARPFFARSIGAAQNCALRPSSACFVSSSNHQAPSWYTALRTMFSPLRCMKRDPSEHIALLEIALGRRPCNWWQSLQGGIACATRWGTPVGPYRRVSGAWHQHAGASFVGV